MTLLQESREEARMAREEAERARKELDHYKSQYKLALAKLTDVQEEGDRLSSCIADLQKQQELLL